jgi:hypothetical protein
LTRIATWIKSFIERSWWNVYGCSIILLAFCVYLYAEWCYRTFDSGLVEDIEISVTPVYDRSWDEKIDEAIQKEIEDAVPDFYR